MDSTLWLQVWGVTNLWSTPGNGDWLRWAHDLNSPSEIRSPEGEALLREGGAFPIQIFRGPCLSGTEGPAFSRKNERKKIKINKESWQGNYILSLVDLENKKNIVILHLRSFDDSVKEMLPFLSTQQIFLECL